MSSLSITVVVPRLPPNIDGLGDYGLALSKQLHQDFGVISKFIVCDPLWAGPTEIEGFKVQKVNGRSASELLDILKHDQKVLLHYVGYGYAKRGCPTWLIQGLSCWKNMEEGRQLISMFHELYAFGPIWSSQFWTSPLQKQIATSLIRLSDRCLTSKIKYAEVIAKLSLGKHERVRSLPVFSNVGEPQDVLPLKDRVRRLVIFGGKGPRERVFKGSIEALERVCKELKIVEILDIGTPTEVILESINGLPIKSTGVLSPSEVSELLSTSLVGFFNYPTEFLSKSGIFAAYCSHGVIPIGTWYEGQDVDQVEEGVHYWLGDKYSGEMSIVTGQKIAEGAHRWYQGHSCAVVAKVFWDHLK